MIEPGGTYGELIEPPPEAVRVASDGEAREAIIEAITAGVDLPPLLLTGGDLHRTLGGRTDRRGSHEPLGLRFPVDLGLISTGTDRSVFLAHAAVHNPRWAGRFAVVMNAQWLDGLDLGPRSHPGDGLLDITLGELTPRQRLLARRRARSGTHLPHPSLTMLRVPALDLDFERLTAVALDGVPWRRVMSASVRIHPAALQVHL